MVGGTVILPFTKAASQIVVAVHVHLYCNGHHAVEAGEQGALSLVFEIVLTVVVSNSSRV